MEGKAISFDISIVFDSTTVNQEKRAKNVVFFSIGQHTVVLILWLSLFSPTHEDKKCP